MGQDRQTPAHAPAAGDAQATEAPSWMMDPMAALAGSVGNGAMQERMAGPAAPDGGSSLLDLAPEVVPAAGAPAASPQSAPAAIEDAETPAETVFAGAAHRLVYDALRKRAFSVAWMSALQADLGVPVTGVASLEVVNKILEDHPIVAATKKKKVPSVETQAAASFKAAIAAYKTKFADLKGIPEAAESSDLKKNSDAKGAGAEAPEDAAMQAELGITYAQYATTVLKNGSFLGYKVLAHPEFHARLANATAYLQAKFPGKAPSEIGKELGVFSVSHFRATTPTSDQMYHGLGFAIDINKPTNDWHFGKTDDSWEMGPLMGHVAQLFGTTEIRSAAGMAKNAKKETTEGAFSEMERSNQDLIRYRDFSADPAKLEAFYNSPECPAGAKKRSLADWKKLLASDEKILRNILKNEEGKSDKENRGFMDLKLETVQAMRDAAGLRWGGTDLGGDSGDLMHFDGGFMSTAISLRGKVKEERASQKAAKAAKAKAAAAAAPAPTP